MKTDMQCVKTGCHLYSEEYQEYFLGDLYQKGDIYVLKAMHRSHEPLRARLHFKATRMEFWQMGQWHVCFMHKDPNGILDFEGLPLTEAF